MYCFKSLSECGSLVRAYALRHCYQEARLFEKSKPQNVNTQQALSNCLIIRKQRIKNETDFGYKQELKTNILKKMHFVYLQKIQDLIAFLWQHAQAKELVFGLILIQNIEQYFGEHFQYRQCGTNFLIFMKLLKLLVNKIRIKGRICFSYTYNAKIFYKQKFQEFLRSEQCTDWQVCEKQLLKNGQRYECQQTKNFFNNYSISKPLENTENINEISK